MNVRRTLGPAVLLAALGSCGGPTPEVDQAVGELVVCGSGPTVDGIDVSTYQGTVNWPMVRTAGKRFAIARIYHWPNRDVQFDRNWREMRANGLIRGGYIYFDPRYDVATQANAVVSAVGRLAQGDLPVTLDIEQPQPGLPAPAQYAAMVRDLADRIEAGTGRRPMIYTGHYYWPGYVQSTAFRAYPLWHAQYTTTQPCPNIADAWSAWSFWQFSSTGRVSGITGNVDLDRFNGTYAELQGLAGYPSAADAGTPGDVPVVSDVPAVRDVPVVRDIPIAADVPVVRDVPAVVDASASTDANPGLDAASRRDVVLAPDVTAVDAGPDPADAPVVDDVDLSPDVGESAPPAAEPGGCGCHVGAPSDGSTRVPSSLAAIVAGLLLRRRRRAARPDRA